jgi:hypothetical protein
VSEACPVRSGIEPTDRLFVPHRKRMSMSYVTSESGGKELFIYYGIKEISFDEERLFSFGEQLTKHHSFTAEAATNWGPGYAWDEVRPLLEALVEEGIVKRGDAEEDERGGGLVPSQLPPSVCPVPRAWSAAEAESITRDLGKRAVEVGYLEAAMPVFRIAHPALDGDGRQVGEANVYPPALRLDRETEWRVCQYSGSRYRDDSPMNVTALKAMIKHWKPMMATILEVRAELRRRLAHGEGNWTIGELHLFACVVLSLPAFLLMKGGGASPQRPLHPVLSSLFRITDGIRMTTYEMLFLISEHTRRPEERTTATELYEYAERNGVLISDAGVCAGPTAMIEEFLAVAVDGKQVEGTEELMLPEEVRELLAQLPAAMDYGLYGLQSWGIVSSVWLAMSRAYETLLRIVETAAGANEKLLIRLRADWEKLKRAQITLEYDREVHLRAYVDAYELAWRALRAPVGAPWHAEQIVARPENAAHRTAAATLRSLLAARFAGSELDGTIEPITEVLVHYLREEQAILSSATAIQAAINALLDRPRPDRHLSARDVRVFFTMNGGSFPYLFDTLEDELGVRVECTADTIEVSDRRAS